LTAFPLALLQACHKGRSVSFEQVDEGFREVRYLKADIGNTAKSLRDLRVKAKAYSDEDYISYSEQLLMLLQELDELCNCYRELYWPLVKKVVIDGVRLELMEVSSIVGNKKAEGKEVEHGVGKEDGHVMFGSGVDQLWQHQQSQQLGSFQSVNQQAAHVGEQRPQHLQELQEHPVTAHRVAPKLKHQQEQQPQLCGKKLPTDQKQELGESVKAVEALLDLLHMPSRHDWRATAWRYPPNEYVLVKPKGRRGWHLPVQLPGVPAKLPKVRRRVDWLQEQSESETAAKQRGRL
jgi:hypothetical protein